MVSQLNRRAALGLGTIATAGAVLGLQPAAAGAPDAFEADPLTESTPIEAARRIRAAYNKEAAAARGNWQAYITVPGSSEVAVSDEPDLLVEAYSVNKIAVAVAVLDKVDRKQLSLTQRINVTAAIAAGDGDGIFRLDGAYPSSVTIGHVLAALLTVSDDVAARLCGELVPTAEINSILAKKGFRKTQLQPVANPHRFYLGRSTARETHALLRQLVTGRLLSRSSTNVILSRMRSPIAFTDGIRKEMSSAERSRVATKAGWFGSGRHESGIMFSRSGKPSLIYSIFANGQAGAGNFGATHPALRARARMGRAFFDAVSPLPGESTEVELDLPLHGPSNGG
ncbi:serine hydrolase [Asanoa iriomotensis]|uniref:Beta-lactamase n=1 Tax=Asanoa iriomotensis TaxID=234613 RepID=A0ABQ4CEK4_9ACTN|nr:serine hydrolase [Asanoa iriomotensis]GIF61207.1 serine hydrolase [Asanoa iriomotensis]